MQRTALFRADASPQLGGGHVRRCLVLADALRLEGWTCSFAIAPGSAELVPHLARSGHQLFAVESRDAGAVAEATENGFDLAVIDHYGLDAEFERGCRAWANSIMVIDDLANRPHDCDVLLDPTLGRTGAHYRALVGSGIQLLLGPTYALMESEFFRRRLALSPAESDPIHAFVCFGAADPANLSGKTVAALRMTRRAMRIDVAVGAMSPNVESLQDVAADDHSPASIVVDGKDIPGMMASAQIAIGAGGGMGWERCCLGLPSLIITVADNQLENAAALQEAGAARWVGKADTVSLGTIASAATALIEGPATRQAMRAAALGITDGLGANRAISAILGPVKTKDGARVSLRPAAREHRDAMLTWQTAPGARRYARSPRPPGREEHERWFYAKLADPKCVFNVVMRDDEPVGVLRYDWHVDEQAFEVSILMAAERQGQGIASAALALGRRLLPDSLIVADVDPANVTSAALFERAGYRRTDRRKYVLPPLNATPARNGLAAPLVGMH